MQYIFKNKKVFASCVEYLKNKKIAYAEHVVGDIYILVVFEQDKKNLIESEKKEFSLSEDIDLEYGYLVGKNYKVETKFTVKDRLIGSDKATFISGPCSVENEDTMLAIAKKLKVAGVDFFRAGAFKPRTSPYDFQGIGRDGIDILNKVSKEVSIPVVSEIMDVRNLDFMYDKIDIFQVGTRNMYNYSLLKELGKIDKPVLMKRAFSASIREFLLSAEYIMKEGNEEIILCERGIRTFSDISRNTLDISAVPILKELSHLPVVVDPSHASGDRKLIKSLSCAAIAAGADGLVIESHVQPDLAWSDSVQTLSTDEIEKIIGICKAIKKEIS